MRKSGGRRLARVARRSRRADSDAATPDVVVAPIARRRRSPEQATEELLAAAGRVFARVHPDQAGLKEVAREAGVSHALVTHYFGTYAGLVEAVLERRIRALRATMLVRLQEPGMLEQPEEMLRLLFDALADPVHLRLTRWMLASERPGASHAIALREKGLREMAHAIGHALLGTPTPAQLAKLEVALLAAVSAAYGYAMGKHAFAGALGRAADAALDDQMRLTIGAMLRAHLGHELGLHPVESKR